MMQGNRMNIFAFPTFFMTTKTQRHKAGMQYGYFLQIPVGAALAANGEAY